MFHARAMAHVLEDWSPPFAPRYLFARVRMGGRLPSFCARVASDRSQIQLLPPALLRSPRPEGTQKGSTEISTIQTGA